MYKESLVLLLLRAFLSALWTGPLFGLTGCQRKDTGRTNYRTDIKTRPECQKEPTRWSCNKFHVLSCSSVASWLHPTPAVLFKIDSPHPVITHLFGRCLDITLDLRLVSKSWGVFGTKCRQKKRSTTTPLKHPSNETCQRSYCFDAWITLRVRDTDRNLTNDTIDHPNKVFWKKRHKKNGLWPWSSMWSIYTLTAARYLVSL